MIEDKFNFKKAKEVRESAGVSRAALASMLVKTVSWTDAFPTNQRAVVTRTIAEYESGNFFECDIYTFDGSVQREYLAWLAEHGYDKTKT